MLSRAAWRVRGYLKTRSWSDPSHPEIKHYRTEVIAQHVELGPKIVELKFKTHFSLYVSSLYSTKYF